MDAYRKQRSDEIAMLTRRSNQLVDTVKTQRNELNRLRNDQFESVQGLLTFVHNDGKVAHINLGSADALRPGVTFGVIDGDETRLQDAKVKASIQVTKILGEHLAETRVVSRPEIQYPLIRGDQVWSPFWAPGRVVRIAITNNIDIDGDLKPDTEALEGMIKAAGAEVITIDFTDGRMDGKLDSGMRFLVVGESPVLSGSSAASDERKAQELQALGLIKADAVEKGITVIPVDKLQAYLKSISDSLTTPLGSAVRSKDFPPEKKPSTKGRLPTNVADVYMKDDTGVQKTNEIARP
jgi:hypothetical protein